MPGLHTPRSDAPVILVVTDEPDAVDDVIRGLLSEGRDLTAVLSLLSHRGEMTLEVGDICVDLISRRVSVAQAEVRLSKTEFELLVYLMRHTRRLLGREEILSAVWGYSHDPGTNVLDVYIGYLRRKLSAAGSETPIVTVRSRGYRLDCPQRSARSAAA